MHKMIKEIMHRIRDIKQQNLNKSSKLCRPFCARKTFANASQKAKKPMGTPISELEKNPRMKNNHPKFEEEPYYTGS